MGIEILTTILIISILVLIVREEMNRMALSDQLATLQTTLTAQTAEITRVGALVVANAQAAKDLTAAEATVTAIQSTADSNTSALNAIQ